MRPAVFRTVVLVDAWREPQESQTVQLYRYETYADLMERERHLGLFNIALVVVVAPPTAQESQPKPSAK